MLSSEMWIHILAIALFCCGSADSRKVRGISSSYKRFYREKKSFLCIDGSKLIPFEQVNDDYCDCADGSDEPGTSACPHGRFYCTNLGFRPHYIPSSRVNDGICDCCDASDEYNSHARCQNTCWNLGQRERAYVEGQMRTLDEGLRLKQQLIEEGVLLWREKQAQLRELQQVAEDLQIKLEEHRRKKREADRFKEQTLRALKGGDGAVKPENTLLSSNKGGRISLDEVKAEVVPVHDEERHLGDDEAMLDSIPQSPQAPARANRPGMTLPSRLGSNAAFDVHADGRQTNSGRPSLPSQPSLRRRRSDAQPGSSHHLFELVDIWPSPAPSSHLRGRLDPLPLLFFFYFVQHTSFSFFTCTKKKYPLSFFFFSLAPPHVCLLLRDSILLAL
ncbi:glucosidase 2 subunit beta isoform X4 [Oryzias latipes]|uniref:glucosidase 2 subunit beta isoform X4 n=1 Tax=Oryzias latipes TaxID=8090 RepID=UPI000CE1885A|nr:glucosidase 2 subunit beta isoform X4 [Oryzias latipes]